jgi:FtsP/CotA-like multicopper oxidase with cupredoxin domain
MTCLGDRSFRKLFVALVVAVPLWLPSQAIAETADSTLRDLPEFLSHDGVLVATLDATERRVQVGPVWIDAKVYNSDYAGPVFRVHPGDVMRIKLVNHLSESTNLHFHGLHSSPHAPGDNVHIAVLPGQAFDYEVAIPQNQPAGLYWVHSHVHGSSEAQVTSGLSGTIIIDAPAPAARLGLVERLFVLKDYKFEDSDDAEIAGYFRNIVQSINGATTATVAMHPGETQLWRFSNQSADRIFHLSVAGHSFRVINVDGVAASGAASVDMLDILPASRVEVLADAGLAGSYDIVSHRVLTGLGPGRSLNRRLGAVVVAGVRMVAAAPITPVPAVEDLRARPIDAKRTVVFSQTKDAEHYLIDGRLFDPARIDLRVPLGNIEEWTIRNESNDLHVFHIHQLHFQVTEINGQPQPFSGYVDGVTVPEMGAVKIRLAFTDRAILGTFMYHCHILEHEDKGMMAQIEVYDPAIQSGPLRRLRNLLWGEQLGFGGADICRAKGLGA